MANGHQNLKRIIHRCIEELSSTKKIAKVTSLKKALITLHAKFDIQMMNLNGYKESKHVERRLIKKHDIMMEYFNKTFKSFLDTYDFRPILCDYDAKYGNRIWVCWWQGIEQAPELVKMCIQSIMKHAGNHKVTVLTEKNYKDYVNLPDWIEEKRKEGKISKTHYSDILRIELLSKYGGMWLDATFLCTGDLDKYFCEDLWSIKRPDYLHCSVASGYFANYSFQCSPSKRWIFGVIKDFLLYYWKTNDQLVDYLFLDYLIVLVQQHSEEIRKNFKIIKNNNPNCDDLLKVLNKKYDDDLWKQLTLNTSLFKLTWKKKIKRNKENTFYKKLIFLFLYSKS